MAQTQIPSTITYQNLASQLNSMLGELYGLIPNLQPYATTAQVTSAISTAVSGVVGAAPTNLNDLGKVATAIQALQTLLNNAVDNDNFVNSFQDVLTLLQNFAEGTDLAAVIADKVGSTTFNAAITNLQNSLSNYVTTAALTTRLSNYVTATQLTTTLSSYAFSADVAKRLKIPNIDSSYPKFQPITTGSISLGDSMTVPLSANKGWSDYLGDKYMVYKPLKFAVSGTGVRRAYANMAANLPYIAKAPTFTMVGYNNTRVTTGQAVRYEAINAGHRAMAAIQFASRYYFPSMGATGSIVPFTYSVSYTATGNTAVASSVAQLQDYASRTIFVRNNDATNAGANYFNRPTITAGETASIGFIYGDAIAIGTWACDGTSITLSRIQVTVDGVVKTTYDPNGKYYTGFSASLEAFTTDGICNDAIILTGLGDGYHNIVLTFLDGGKRGAFDYLAVLKTPAQAALAPLYINDIPHGNNLASVGNNYPGYVTTNAILDGATASRKAALLSAFPGYDKAFCFVDIMANGYYNPDDTTQVQSDGIHPTDVGELNIGKRVEYYMGESQYVQIEQDPNIKI